MGLQDHDQDHALDLLITTSLKHLLPLQSALHHTGQSTTRRENNRERDPKTRGEKTEEGYKWVSSTTQYVYNNSNIRVVILTKFAPETPNTPSTPTPPNNSLRSILRRGVFSPKLRRARMGGDSVPATVLDGTNGVHISNNDIQPTFTLTRTMNKTTNIIYTSHTGWWLAWYTNYREGLNGFLTYNLNG